MGFLLGKSTMVQQQQHKARPGYVLVAVVKRVRNPKTGRIQVAPPGSGIPIWRKI